MSKPNAKQKELEPTEAGRLLQCWIDGHEDRSQAALARLLDADDAQLSRWISGERKPGLEAALKIAAELGIGATLWYVAPRVTSSPVKKTG